MQTVLNPHLLQTIQGIIQGEITIDPCATKQFDLKTDSYEILIQNQGRHTNRIFIKIILYNQDVDNPKDSFVDDAIESRFNYFKFMEEVLWVVYQEYQNNDPIDFRYEYEADYINYKKVTFKVTCLDYFS